MGEFIKVSTVEKLPVGKCAGVVVDGTDVGLFNVDGTICAMENTCPHQGAPLTQGSMKEGVVMCPWHMWRFDVKTGKSLTAPGADMTVYEVKIENGEIFVRLP
ncbi:MAG: Rieske 2Fe-2S domain-containing protein [Verrucomicrobiae bacterium]|nr:Rieske 2Fe-2S domain-containing protein [Verrucomicrobiae bacterium]